MTPRTVSLTEYQPTGFSATEISSAEGETLWQHWQKKVFVEFPSPKTQGEWRLTSQGWVGHLPITPDFGIRIHPRVPLRNLFGMLEYAYRLRSVQFLPGLIDCESLEGFFERLVRIVASRASDRIRKGLHREYVQVSERLSMVRGHVDLESRLRTPWMVEIDCEFDEHTADLKANQIITWTLWRATRTGLCGEPVLQTVRKVLRAMLSVVSLRPTEPRDCVLEVYHRLNEDYRPIHALCRLILENLGPSHEIGQHQMLPFIVNMSHLFELFVAEWLTANIDPRYTCQPQERVQLGDSGDLVFRIDIVVCDTPSMQPLCVIDTKYKIPDRPSPADIAQAVTYATLKDCRVAVLVYPKRLNHPLDLLIGQIRVRSMTFSLDGDLDDEGKRFLIELFESNRMA
ncbi:MAG: hypothetical protein WKF77_10570 [Planctomycetaceae bacterium]